MADDPYDALSACDAVPDSVDQFVSGFVREELIPKAAGDIVKSCGLG